MRQKYAHWFRQELWLSYMTNLRRSNQCAIGISRTSGIFRGMGTLCRCEEHQGVFMHIRAN
jgi:hypothetical protein